MRNVAVAGDLVGRIDHNHALAKIVGEYTSDFPQHRRFADAWTPKKEGALARLDQVANDARGPIYRPSDPTGETDDASLAITNRADSVERAFDSSAVITAKIAQLSDYPFNIGLADLSIA
jgi:hypothetical protein